MGSAEQLTDVGGKGSLAAHTGTRKRTSAGRALSAWAAFLLAAGARCLLTSAATLALCSVLPAAFGLITTTVMSDSMAPDLRSGDVVISRAVPTAAVHVGEVLLVDDPDHPGRLRMHRLAAERDGRYVLKGDANLGDDSATVDPRSLHGVGFMRVPFAGLPVLWLRTGQVVPLLLLAAVLLVLVGLTGLEEGDRSMAERASATAARLRRTLGPLGRLPLSRALLALLIAGTATGAAVAHPGAGAVFSRTTANTADSFGAGTFDCPSRTGFPAASLYYGYTSASGTTETDLAGNSAAGTLASGVTRVGGNCTGNASPYVTVGSTTGYVAETASVTAPSVYSIALWFKTGTKAGELADFGDSRTAASGTSDRILYFTANGYLSFAARVSGSLEACVGSTNMADSTWHLVVATFSGGTFNLWTDNGTSQCSGTQAGSASSFTGYWRFGYDADPASNAASPDYFSGALDETAVYPTVLSQTQVRTIYAAGH